MISKASQSVEKVEKYLGATKALGTDTLRSCRLTSQWSTSYSEGITPIPKKLR